MGTKKNKKDGNNEERERERDVRGGELVQHNITVYNKHGLCLPLSMGSV